MREDAGLDQDITLEAVQYGVVQYGMLRANVSTFLHECVRQYNAHTRSCCVVRVTVVLCRVGARKRFWFLVGGPTDRCLPAARPHCGDATIRPLLPSGGTARRRRLEWHVLVWRDRDAAVVIYGQRDGTIHISIHVLVMVMEMNSHHLGRGGAAPVRLCWPKKNAEKVRGGR